MKDIYYNITIKTQNNGKDGVSMITGGKTIEEAMASGIKLATYYLGLGYKVWLTDLRGYCQNCHGEGNVRKGVRVIKYIKCRDCKGQGKTGPLMEDIPVIKSDSVNITIL